MYEQPLPPASLATKEQLKLAEKLAKEHLDLAKEEQLIPERNASNTEADEKCEFEATFEDNLRYIQSYQLDEAVPYVEKLQLYSDPVPSNMSHAQLQSILSQFGRQMRKRAFGHIRTAEAQIRLCAV